MNLISPTFGQVTMSRVAEIIEGMVTAAPEYKYELVVGTDSQNHSKTKIVTVVSLYKVSKGGIFFYTVDEIHKISNIPQKLKKETELSLCCMEELLHELDKRFDITGFDYTCLSIAIHIDAGHNGPTKEVIPEITGWVKSMGYDCYVKPESIVASTIADKISK